jgi:hypothetical protein
MKPREKKPWIYHRFCKYCQEYKEASGKYAVCCLECKAKSEKIRREKVEKFHKKEVKQNRKKGIKEHNKPAESGMTGYYRKLMEKKKLERKEMEKQREEIRQEIKQFRSKDGI